MGLTSEQRRMLKELVDRQRRELVANDPTPRCSGCGCDHDTRSIGCQTCMERHRRRAHKIRCARCGGPASARRSSSKRYWQRDTGLCVDCYRASRRAA